MHLYHFADEPVLYVQRRHRQYQRDIAKRVQLECY